MRRKQGWIDQDGVPGLMVDFSAESTGKDEIKAALMEKLPRRAETAASSTEENTMNTGKKRMRRSGVIALAACLALGAVSVTAYGVVQYLKLGEYARYDTQSAFAPGEELEEARQEALAQPLPEGLQGEVYTQDGELAETWGDLEGGSYSAEGVKVVLREDGVVGSMEEAVAELDESSSRFDTLEEVQGRLAFEMREFGYVPEAYELEGYRLFNGEEGAAPEKNSKYLSMHFYKDGDPAQRIYVQARLMDEETGFEAGVVEDLRETTINGHDAVVFGSNVDILIDDVMYMIGGGDLPVEEILKMAESLGR